MINEVARILDGEGTEKVTTWRDEQLDRLWTDRVDHTMEALRFLGAHQRTVGKCAAVADRTLYLTTNQDRMLYQTFRAAGYSIGSGRSKAP